MAYHKKHSLRRQMVITFVSALLILIGLILLINTSFLEKYYVMHKTRDLTSLYTIIDRDIVEGKIKEEEVKDKIERQAAKKNISIIIMDPNNEICFTTDSEAATSEHDELYFEVCKYRFDKNYDNGKIL